MKIDIIIVYLPRYQHGHEKHFVPPVTGIYLAAITPPQYTVNVIHQQVEPINFDTDADVIALSFFTGFAPEAYRLALEFKKRGLWVVAGGPHVTFSPDEALQYCDSVVIGEAESVWASLLQDIEDHTLKPRYIGQPLPLDNLPIPRYDLLPNQFFVPHILQATRGCSFTCSFCTTPKLNPGFRTRPIEDVIRDIKYNHFKYWWQRKVVWFWDDNLTFRRTYIKTLLTAMIPLKRWWLTQASMDIAQNQDLLDLMKKSGCIGVFFGVESFGEASLKEASKKQNKVQEYQQRIAALHKKGICVMGGFIAGFDGDTPTSVKAMAKQLYDIGVDVPFLSLLTPYPGTTLYTKLEGENRLLKGRGWEFYNGYNVSFLPNNMTPNELLQAHRELWKEAFSLKYSVQRIIRAFFHLRLGAFLMCAVMNTFYCVKAMRGNLPVCFDKEMEGEKRKAKRIFITVQKNQFPNTPLTPLKRGINPLHNVYWRDRRN